MKIRHQLFNNNDHQQEPIQTLWQSRKTHSKTMKINQTQFNKNANRPTPIQKHWNSSNECFNKNENQLTPIQKQWQSKKQAIQPEWTCSKAHWKKQLQSTKNDSTMMKTNHNPLKNYANQAKTFQQYLDVHRNLNSSPPTLNRIYYFLCIES